ncbi:hypothetical protein FACS189452_04830 [Bacteroidia bacterium]|nr:hypothetical protein FACS189452_04830 [Bacteroidia bacterium]
MVAEKVFFAKLFGKWEKSIIFAEYYCFIDMAIFNKSDLFKDIYTMFLNIATYVITGVLITSFFANIKGSALIVYGTGVAVSLGTVIIAVFFLFLSQKK